MNIENLKSTIAKKGGLAPANRFNVIFAPPAVSLLNINPQQIVCLRDNSAVKGQYFSKEKCTFFEISSDIEIKTEIDLKRGNEKVRKVPVF